jgi:hypothetical protein
MNARNTVVIIGRMATEPMEVEGVPGLMFFRVLVVSEDSEGYHRDQIRCFADEDLVTEELAFASLVTVSGRISSKYTADQAPCIVACSVELLEAADADNEKAADVAAWAVF